MVEAGRGDLWSAGDAYELYVGRWSRRVAREFLGWLGLPPGGDWIDVGCGTGTLAQAILEECGPISVAAADTSPGFLQHARRQTGDLRVMFVQADAEALPCAGRSFDAAVSGLVLNFVGRPLRAVREMRRVVRPGGTVAAYVWDYAEGMQMMRRFWDAAIEADPAAAALDEGVRFPLCSPARLASLFSDAGLARVETRVIGIPTVFSDFDDFWRPFLGGQGPAPGYCMGLAPERREALREQLHAALPVRADGTIPLEARAFAVRGR
jgi:SAM-dependent methyltransferase